MSDTPRDFDPIALVIDWLDACRTRDLDALLAMYSADASLECKCSGPKVLKGRRGLETYWRPRIDAASPNAFRLDEIVPTSDGVVLDYLSYEGKPVRIMFRFAADGKIQQTRCGPVAQMCGRDLSIGLGPAE